MCRSKSSKTGCVKQPVTQSVLIKSGDCYKAAFVAVQELVAIGQSPTLVHGWITSVCQDQPFRHAWVEVDETCFEVSNGQREPFF